MEASNAAMAEVSESAGATAPVQANTALPAPETFAFNGQVYNLGDQGDFARFTAAISQQLVQTTELQAAKLTLDAIHQGEISLLTNKVQILEGYVLEKKYRTFMGQAPFENVYKEKMRKRLYEQEVETLKKKIESYNSKISMLKGQLNFPPIENQ